MILGQLLSTLSEETLPVEYDKFCVSDEDFEMNIFILPTTKITIFLGECIGFCYLVPKILPGE